MAYSFPTDDSDSFDEDEQRDLQRSIESQQDTSSASSPSIRLPQGMVLDKPAGAVPEAYQPLERTSAGIQAKLPQGMVLDDKPTYQLPEGMVLDKPVAGADQAAPTEYQIPYSGALYPNIAQQRAKWVEEIESNPRLREYAAAAMSQEAGDDTAYLGALESLFNRTQQRGSRIAKQLTNGFYGPVNRGEVDRIVRKGVQPWMYEKFDKAFAAVKNGSDLIEGRTDQGMINEIVGPKAKYGSEYFGYMGGDPSWSMQHQRNKGQPGAATRGPSISDRLIPLGGEQQGADTSGALLPPGMVLDKPQKARGQAVQLPSGMTLDQAPKKAEVPSQQLPSGEIAPTVSEGQEGAAAAQLVAAEPTVKKAQGPLPKLSASVARMLGVDSWIDQDSGMEIRRAKLAGSPEESLPITSEIHKPKAGEPSLGVNVDIGKAAPPTQAHQELLDKLDGLNTRRVKLVQTFTPDQTDKAHEIQQLENDILATKNELAKLPAPKEKPKTLMERIEQSRKDAKATIEYGISVASAGGQQFEQSALSSLAGTQGIQAGATAKQVNPFKDAAEAKQALPTLQSSLKIFKEGIDNINKAYDPSNPQQVKLLDAYTKQVQDIERKLGFAQARLEGKSGEGIGAAIHQLAKERETEITEKTMPEVAKKWEPFIDQVKKDDTLHSLSKTVAGSMAVSAPMMLFGPVSMPVAAVTGFVAMYSSTYNDKLTEIKESMKKQGKPYNEQEARQIAHIAALSETPLEEIGDLLGAKTFAKALWATSKLGVAAKGPVLKRIAKEAGAAAKELGPTVVAEGLITNPAQSVIDDVINEKYGIQEPTTAYQKLTKAAGAGVSGATSALAMWGLPTMTVKGAKFLSSLPDPNAPVPAGPQAAPGIAPAIVPAGTLTGAAAQMGGGQAPFTPPYTPPAAGAAAPAGTTPATQAPSGAAQAPSAAPIAPTEEVKVTKSNTVRNSEGKKGEVVSEDKGKLEVQWEDDTKSTVEETEVERRTKEETVRKNTVMMVPTAKGTEVHYYDDKGKKKAQFFKVEQDAHDRAKEIAKEKNLTGYSDANDTFVRTAATPATQAETTTAAAPVTPAESQADVIAKKVVAKIGQFLGVKPDSKATGEKMRGKLSELERLTDDEANSRFLNLDVGGRTVQQALTDRMAGLLPNGAPVPIVLENNGSGAAVHPDPHTGGIKLHLDPRVFGTELESMGPEERAAYFHKSIEEEEVHIADHVSLWNDFQRLPPKEKARLQAESAKYGVDKATGLPNHPAFNAYKDEVHSKIIKDLRDIRNGLSAGQKAQVDQIIIDAINAYQVQGGLNASEIRAEGGYADPNTEGVYEWMLQNIRGEGHVAARQVDLMAEIVRMAVQSERTGSITEDTLAQVLHGIKKWVRDQLERIKRTWENVFGPNKSPAGERVLQVLKARLDAINAILDSAEVKRKLERNGVIQSLPDASPQLKAFWGQTNVVPIDPNTGQQAVQYHYHFRDISRFDSTDTNDIGYHVGTQKAAFDRCMDKTKGKLDEAIGAVTIAIHIRLERPVHLPDLGGWHYESVAKELIDRGYVTTEEIAEINNRGIGFLNNDTIKKLLQSKGYDGIAYINRHEGLRQLTMKEADARVREASIVRATDGAVLIVDPTNNVIGRGNSEGEAKAKSLMNLTRQKHPVDLSFILFEGNQLKSAKANNGSYSLGDRNIMRAKGMLEKTLESRIVDMHNRTGGSSINAALGDVTEKDVYAVEAYPDITMIIPGPKIVEQDIFDLQNKIREHGIDLNVPYLTMGTWVNPETKNSEIGVSALVPDMRAALEMAEKYNQIAIWYHGGIGSLIFTQGAMSGANLPSLGERTGFIAKKSIMPVTGKPRLNDPYSFNITNLPPGKIESVDIISDKAITESSKRGQDWKDWYTTFDKYMRRLTAKYPEYRPLFAWWFAATSPHNLVGSNITASMKAFRNFVVTGDPAVPGPGMPGFMKTHWPNLRRATGLPSQAVTEPTAVGGGVIGGGVGLTGGKVPEFAPALLNDPYAIAVDMHVASVLFGTEEPTEWQRFAGQMAILRISERMGWKPAEVQAALFADDIMQRQNAKGGKSPLARAEDYMKKYETEFLNLIEQDQAGGAKGAGIGRSILERVSTRVGPERFLRDASGNIEAIQRERVIAINPAIASRISLTGPKGPIAKKALLQSKEPSIPAKGLGRGQNGQPTTAENARIPSAFLNLPRMWNGVKQVFWESPGCQALGDAVHQHTDLLKKYMAEFSSPFLKWVGEASGHARKMAINEYQEWQQKKVAGLPLPALSPEAKKLKAVYDGVIAKINAKNQYLNLKVKHPDTGNYVKIPNIEHPSKIRGDVMQTMRDAQWNHSKWRELRDALFVENILPSTATDEQVQNHFDKVLRNHTTNSAFGRFFFFPKSMPSTAFDYSYEAMHEFLGAWTQKIALVEAFGTNPKNDIFDIAASKARDLNTQNYIRAVKRLAYGETINDFWGRMATSAGQLAMMWHLVNFAYATKNLVSGMAFNAQSLGIINFTKAFFQVNPFRAINDGVERGIIVHDMMNIMADADRIEAQTTSIMGVKFKKFGAAAQEATSAGLNWTGAKLGENWVRGVAMRGSESMLRHAMAEYKKNPRSGKSLRYAAYLQRLGFREGRHEALLREGGKGELTDEYLRAAVNEIQGGYTYADVPVYMETPAGKALFKYRKWGAEQAKHFEREVVMPMLRAVPGVKKETVQVEDASGNLQDVEVPPGVLAFMPAARYLVMIAAAGAGEEWLLEKMFGMHPKTARLAEAMAQFKQSNWEGTKALLNKVWNWHLLAGSMGGLGGYIQEGLAFTGLQDAKPGESAAESIPALDPFLKIADQVKIFMEQGNRMTAYNIMPALMSISGVRVGVQAAAQITDVIGVQTRFSETIANRQDLATAKGLQRRFADDEGYKLKKPSGERPEKTDKSVWRDPLDEALMIGDIDTAKQILRDVKKGMRGDQWEAEVKSLKSHIRSKQPIQATGGSEASRHDFMQWMKENASPYEQELVKRLDKTYRHTAERLPLGMEFKPPTLEEILERRQSMRLRQLPTEYQPSE